MNTSNRSSPALTVKPALLAGMVLAALWIMINPRPYGLALLIAATIPALCYVRLAVRQLRFGHHQIPVSHWDAFLFVAGIVMVIAASVRAVFDVRILDWPEYLLTVMGATALLALVTNLCNRVRGVGPTEVLMFALYSASMIGLTNAYLDASTPQYVAGRVTRIWSEGSGRGHREYYKIAPYLARQEKTVELGPFDTLQVKLGDQICSVLYGGRLGFRRYEVRIGACPARSVGDEIPGKIDTVK